MADDVALLERYAATEDTAAFDELVRRYSRLVYGTCLRVTGNRQDAEDAAQECFLELAKNAKRVRCSLPGWLHKVAHHRSVNTVRNAATQRHYEHEAAGEDLFSTCEQPSDLTSQVDELVETLPEHLRLPIVLHYFSGYTQIEIADELGLSQATVSRLLDRGLSILRKQLQNVGIVIPAIVFETILSKTVECTVPESVIAALQKTAVLVKASMPASTTHLTWTSTIHNFMSTILGKVALVTVGIVITSTVVYQVASNRIPENATWDTTGLVEQPDMQPIAEALIDQEEKCGGSLEVNYTSIWQKLVDGQQTEQRITQYHYIRTPEAIRVEMLKSGSLTTTSYDRNTNEYRILSQQETDNPTCRIGTGLGDPLGVRYLLETVRYPLHQGPMCEKIKFGTTASEQTEQIDGFDCKRIEVPSQRVNLEKYIVWLDPAIGYNPRRIVFMQKNIQACLITFSNYEHIGNGVWFPKNQSIRYGSTLAPNENFVIDNTVTRINIGRTIPKNELLVKFPSGLKPTRDKHNH